MGQETEEENTEEQTVATEQTANKVKQQQIEVVLKFVIKLCGVLLALWAIFTFVFGLRQVSGESMYPRLRDGDLILYYRLEQSYQADDVVVYKVNGRIHEGRIVAQAGDVVDISEDGKLLINGNIQQEEVFYETETMGDAIAYPYTVMGNSYFVLSDLRTSGLDSRTYGSISRKDIDGKVITFLRRRSI